LAFGVMVIFVAAGFLGLLPADYWRPMTISSPRNIVRLAGVLLRLGLTIGLLALRASLTILAIVQLACLLFDFALCWFLVRPALPQTRIRLADFDWSMARSIFAFSIYVLVLNAGARLSFETDAMVIGGFMDVGSFLTSPSPTAFSSTDGVLACHRGSRDATATRLPDAGQTRRAASDFLKWSKIALSLTVAAGVFLIVLGPRFIALWIDPHVRGAAGRVLQILMVSYLIFLPVRAVALPILMGLGKAGVPTIGFLVAGIINVVLSIVLVRPLGLAGVALTTPPSPPGAS